MTAARTTVVVAVWDEYVSQLEAAIQSIQGQDSEPEIVVVDNASGVALPDLPGATIVRTHGRLSLGAARNLGLDRVQTPHVVFWDADDVILPGTLAFLEDGAASGPAAFATAVLEEPSRARHRWPRPWVARLMRAPRMFALLDSVWSLYPTTGSTIIDAQLARAAGGFADADSGEDWCLGVSLAFRGRIAFSERPGRLYSIGDPSVWARHMTPSHLLGHARAVRGRIRTDPAIPRWVRALLPLIAIGQWSAIVAHVALDATRRIRNGRGR